MNRKFKAFKILLVTALLTVILAACSSNNGNNESNSSNAGNGGNPTNDAGQTTEGSNEAIKDPYDLTLALPIFGAVPADIAEVQAEVNKITQAEINTTVTLLPISIGAWGQQLNLMNSGGEKLDLYFTFGQGYSYAVAQGTVKELDELLAKYGQGIVEAVGEDNMKAAVINGKIYSVPVTGVYASVPGIAMRKDLIEKYNIDITSIKSLQDLDSIFQTIKDNEPNIAPLASGLSSPLEFYRSFDRLGDRYGVLPGYDNGFKIENYYESAEYADLLNMAHKWYKAGYINKDAATTQTNPVDLVKAGKAFSYMIKSEPGTEAGNSRQAGTEVVVVNLMPNAYSTTSDLLTGLYSIAQHSENPERAMMMLNLMYTNSKLANLLVWGIEGKHYVKTSETQIEYPEGINPSNVGYNMQAWLLGNPLITYVNSSQAADHWEQVKEFNANAVKSKALGFAFNQDPVKNEITALNNVVEQYRKVLESGTVDPADKLKEFNDKLKAAGLDKVMTEKQKQLDEWVTANQ
ncbi:ABC transporter substrate-binding protein [Paenibacillus sp. YIM B09110]|uniref:ABC transporter substrate-binding protein n=1 Tax=Paenibacillus sp. YIM B09110 TaxID=3126102 RepID=UPI00301CC77E